MRIQMRRRAYAVGRALLFYPIAASLLPLVGLLGAQSVAAQSCPYGMTKCAAPAAMKAAARRLQQEDASLRSQVVQPQALSATNCSAAGTWVESGSYATAGILTMGKNLGGANKHPYCPGIVSVSMTITGASTFSEVAIWSGGDECQSGSASLTWGATCNVYSGTYVNADGSSGVLTRRRSDPLKNLGGTCENTNAVPGQVGQMCGDPINVTTGNVLEHVTDFAGAPGSSLTFTRHYNSLSRAVGPLGHSWSHDFEAKILTLTPTLVQTIRGSQKTFTFNLVAGQWVSDSDVTSRLTQQVNGTGQTVGWRHVTGTNGVETYDAAGRLVTIADPRGTTRSLSYDATSGLLTSVADSFGRSLTFAYDGAKRLSTLTEPNGTSYTYSYDGMGNLAWVVQPGGGALNYLYENASFPSHLTGLRDENNTRFATWTYDAWGQGTASEQPNGVGRVTLAYDVPTNGERTITDSLNRSQTFQYYLINDVMYTSRADLTGSGFPQSSNWTYFADGSVSSYIDYLGNLTCYGYEPTRNLESVKVEGMPYTADACQNLNLYPLPATARVTASAWHPLWRLRTQLAEPKKLTTLVYNGQPNPVGGGSLNCAPTSATLPDGSPIAVLCKRIEQATTDNTGGQGLTPVLDTTVASRTWSYTYNQYGQVLTATDPRGNVSTFIYYPSTTTDHRLGDLQSVTNAVGHVTQFTKYDLAGRLLRSVGPTGATTDTVYTPRGWVSSITVTPSGGGTAQVMGYTYDAVGQRKVATLPDGTTIQYGYDDAHRLTSVTLLPDLRFTFAPACCLCSSRSACAPGRP
jgi:YD repeat-containing protein